MDHSNAAGRKLSGIYKRKTTGHLVKLNKKDIAVFRYGQNVFAIDEKCPHVGMYLMKIHIKFCYAILCYAIINYIILHYVVYCIISYFKIEGNKLLYASQHFVQNTDFKA